MAKFFWDDDFIALLDNNELLIHDGADEAPLWRRSVDSEIVGVAHVGQEVVTLDKGGKLRYWDLALGEETRFRTIPDNPISLSGAHEQRVVVVTNKEVLLFEDGEQIARQRIKMPANAAFSADGSLIGVISANGSCTVCDDQLEVIRTTEPAEMFGRNIAWNNMGIWIITVGKTVYAVEARGQKVRRMTGSKQNISAVACNADGSRFAILLGDKVAMLLETKSKELVAQAKMGSRTITDLFVPNDEWMTLSLLGGDGNKVSLTEEWLVKRTDTHPGRQHNSWVLSINVPGVKDSAEKAPAPKATPAPKPKPAPKATTSTPAAKPAATKPVEPEKPKRSLLRRGCMLLLFIVLGMFAFIVFLIIVGRMAG